MGSVNGRLPISWYHKAGSVECFSTETDLYTRPLGQDGHGYRQQLEGWADTIPARQSAMGRQRPRRPRVHADDGRDCALRGHRWQLGRA